MTDINRIFNEWLLTRDEAAFRLLYERFFHTLLAVACKYVNKEDARDVVQDIFLRLWHSPEKYIGITDFRYYLYRSVQHRCLNLIRSKKVEKHYCQYREVMTDDYFFNALLEEELFLRLSQAIEYLPEKYKQVINLSLDGLSDKEVARKLQINLDTVRTQKKRGRFFLKTRLKKFFIK